jgi:hypothetical protein
MQRQTLASALNAALKQRARSPEIRETGKKTGQASNFLLTALQSSATGMDKIVQRRIGLIQEPVSSLK